MTERDIFRELCENDFSFYVKHALKVIEPETAFEWNWHIDALCHYCERVFYGHYQNLDINIPPRMMKSLIVTVLFPTWIWVKKPSFKIMCASRSNDLSLRFNKQRRDLVESSFFQSLWHVPIKMDTNRADEFSNYQGGFMKSISAMGKVTGGGADLLLSDDLLDAMDAFSKAKRESTNLWYSQAYYNRAQNKKKVMRININQRLHMDDPSGNLEKNHNFKKLVLPMVMTKENLSTVDFVDPRQEGELLFPARYSDKDQADDYKALGVYGWSSQYQQTPKPAGGGIIKDEWIRYYDVLPNIERKIITADLSFKGESTSDYVCFQYWGVSSGKKYLIDIVRGKWSYKQTKENFITFCDKHGRDIPKWIEDKANGPALISDLKSEMTKLKGWPEAHSKYFKAGKVERLHFCSQDFEMGDVYIPRSIELAKTFVDELTSFTEKGSTTGNDDMVDTCTMALLELRKSPTFFA